MPRCRSSINFSLCLTLEVGHSLYDIIHAHSLDGDTAATLAEFSLSEHRFYCFYCVYVMINMSVFNVYVLSFFLL